MKREIFLMTSLLCSSAVFAAAIFAAAKDRAIPAEHWVATWATAEQVTKPAPAPLGRGGTGPSGAPGFARGGSGPAQAQNAAGRGGARPDGPIPPSFNDQTLRMIVRTTLGGKRVRIQLSGAFGANTVRIGAAHIALRAKESEIVPGTDRVLTFGGQPSPVIEPGAVLFSDPVDLDVAPFSDIAVSLFFPQDTGLPTSHPLGLHTAYISAGDTTALPKMPDPSLTKAYFWLSGVDVVAPSDAFAVVAFGDSITDGFRTTLDANAAWPYLLAKRLAANKATAHAAVLNEGYSGNMVLKDGDDVSAFARFDHDILGHPGVKWVILLEGINDINRRGRNANPGSLTSDELIAGFKQLIEKSHAYGIKVIGATIMAQEGVPTASERGEAIRKAANEWMRTSNAFDAIIDFDAVVRDPQHPARMRPELDPGDHIHPNDAGNKLMADAFDLALFTK